MLRKSIRSVDIPETTAPSSGKDRIVAIDVLRGVALLGILLMNAVAFGLGGGAYYDPVVDGATSGLNFAAYAITDVFVEGSMRSVFCMLFGAGVLLFTAKTNLSEGQLRALWYRRTLLLVMFGLVDAYLLLWLGDILYAYGMAGLLLYFARSWSPRTLLSIALLILLFMSVVCTAIHIETKQLWDSYRQVDLAIPTAQLSVEEQQAIKDWNDYLSNDGSSSDAIDEEIALLRSDYLEAVVALAPVNFYLQTQDFLLGSLWDSLSMMLLGMALLKWKVFTAQLPGHVYLSMAIGGLVVGLGVNVAEVVAFKQSGFAPYWQPWNIRPSYDVGRLGLAIGYIGLLMLLCQRGFWSGLEYALASVGRTALTNYLMHSVIFGFLFFGFGLGLIGKLERWALYPIVFVVWILQLYLSSLWLRFFHFGPAEWLWRSLTYGRWQAIKR